MLKSPRSFSMDSSVGDTLDDQKQVLLRARVVVFLLFLPLLKLSFLRPLFRCSSRLPEPLHI